MKPLRDRLQGQPPPRWLLATGLALGLSAFPTHLFAAPPDLLVDSATAQVGVTTSYDGRYSALSYPGGDVPMDRGVCTDVLIRAYRPGDIVTWQLLQGLPHIGIIARTCTPNGTPLVIHNIGQGTRVEDILFRYRITGHCRYFPE